MVTRKRLSARFLPGADPAPAIAEMLRETDAFAMDAALASRDRERLAIVVEELVSNTARHGMAETPISLVLDLDSDTDRVAITIEDNGRAFDPRGRGAFSGPDPETGGGVGLELVGAWCESIAYSRQGNRNRLALRMPRTRP